MITQVTSQSFPVPRAISEIASKTIDGAARAVRVSDLDISKLTDTEFDKELLRAYMQAVDDGLAEVTLSASIINGAKSRIEGNKTLVKNLIDANKRGIGDLVDTNLNEETAKLKALQTQEQLAIQSLEISNGSSTNVLRLLA